MNCCSSALSFAVSFDRSTSEFCWSALWGSMAAIVFLDVERGLSVIMGCWSFFARFLGDLELASLELHT